MRAFRLISFFVLALFAAVLGVKSLHLAGMARIYPSVFIVAVIVGTLAMATRELLAANGAVPMPTEVARLLLLSGASLKRLLAFVAAWVGYPVLLNAAGFIVATTIAVSASLWLLRVRRIGLMLLGAAIFAICLAVLFSTLFYIPTPSGFLDTGLARLLFAITR